MMLLWPSRKRCVCVELQLGTPSMSCRFPMRAQLKCRHAPLYTCILQSTGKVDRNGRSQPDPPRTQRSKPSAMPEIVASEKTSRNNKRGKEFDTQSCNDADQTVKWIRTKLLTWYYPIIFLDFCLHKCVLGHSFRWLVHYHVVSLLGTCNFCLYFAPACSLLTRQWR